MFEAELWTSCRPEASWSDLPDTKPCRGRVRAGHHPSVVVSVEAAWAAVFLTLGEETVAIWAIPVAIGLTVLLIWTWQIAASARADDDHMRV